MRLVAPRQRRGFAEDDVGASQADVPEKMIAKFGQASSDQALPAPPLPVPEQHGSEAEYDKEDGTTECDTPRGCGSADRHKMRAGHRATRGRWHRVVFGSRPRHWARHQGLFVAPRRLETMRIAVMDHAPVCVGATLCAVRAGLISGLRAGRHIMSMLKQIAAAPT